ncbi:MAG: T9SS type A sorting domain-containing protein, partial [Saprospiraceae bacterium]|nr:T9SS type A sorting domain-containing protein [Saprospiraceae bacterium]
SALEEAIFTHKWSENAVARICFLVLDASPHRGAAINASLQKSIREAARLGIRIVPIAASGIQKDTEFLMKFFGLATNGSYVFLTDHSGIGGKHLEPTTDEYKVEPLNNLLVRLITEYTTVETCEGKSEIRFENDPQQQPGPVLQALYYPNPAVEQITLELPFTVQSVTIYDSEGRAVRKLENPVEGANLILLNDLAAGFYTIRILNNGLMQSGKLMVVRT